MTKLERLSKDRQSRPTKSRGVNTYKSRNKLFDEFTDTALLQDADHELIESECLLNEPLQIQPKQQSKKDISGLLNNLERYKHEQIGVTSQPLLNSETIINMSMDNNDIIRIPSLISEPSFNLSSVLSNSRSGKFDGDELFDIELTLPQLSKRGSQTMLDATLFLNSLARKNSFIRTQSITSNEFEKIPLSRNKTLKDLSTELSNKLKRKKSRNLSIEMMQSRFQSRDLESFQDEIDKKSELFFNIKFIFLIEKINEQKTVEEDDEENDSDYCPDDVKKTDNEGNFEADNVNEKEELQQSAKSLQNEKESDVDNITNKNEINNVIMEKPKQIIIDLQKIKELENDMDEEEAEEEEEYDGEESVNIDDEEEDEKDKNEEEKVDGERINLEEFDDLEVEGIANIKQQETSEITPSKIDSNSGIVF